MEEVAVKFRAELDRIGADNRDYLNERISKASGYFLPILADVASVTVPAMSVSADNKDVQKNLSDASAELLPQLTLFIECMKKIAESGFSIEMYLNTRNEIVLNDGKGRKKRQEKEKEKEKKEKPDLSQIYAGNRHPELIVPLTEWRTEQYMAQNIRAYWVLTQRTLLEIADTCPTTKEELLAVNGFGPAKWKQYGEEILELIARYRKD